MNNSLNTYINETITNIIYWWHDRDMVPVTTKFEEWHYCLLGVEIILSSGRQLSIDTNYFNDMGLKIIDEPLNLDWNPEHVKKDMSSHPFFSEIINQKIIDIQLWWCNNLWIHAGSGVQSGPPRYPQELVIETENNGYLLLSSAEAEELKPVIYLFCADEILLSTNKEIASKYDLAQYGKEQYQRFNTKD